MKFTTRLRSLFSGPAHGRNGRETTAVRSLRAALPGIGSDDIVRMNTNINAVLRSHLPRMREQARGLAANNDYVKAFLRMVGHHVVGPSGARMQNRSMDLNGALDQMANTIVESAWGIWTKAKNCDVTAMGSFWDMQQAAIVTMARDGEFFFRKVGKFAGSKHRFALQEIDAKLIDESYWDDRLRIICGVEHDTWGRPTAYYIRQPNSAGEGFVTGTNGRTYMRIPADEMIHGFLKQYPGQTRGLPWIHTSMIRLNQLGNYEEAELIAARISSSKMGFFTSKDDGASLADGEDKDRGYLTNEVSAGSFETLPTGTEFVPFDPQHPGGNFAPFVKATLRGIASGLGVSYNALASDLEGVNFSSIRAGLLEEREQWRSLQKVVQEQFLDPVFESWIEYASLSGALSPLPASKLEKFSAATWTHRGWAWVDPKKDMDAAVIGIHNALRTRTEVLAEQGRDFEETCRQLAAEQAMMARYGVRVEAVTTSILIGGPENANP